MQTLPTYLVLGNCKVIEFHFQSSKQVGFFHNLLDVVNLSGIDDDTVLMYWFVGVILLTVTILI